MAPVPPAKPQRVFDFSGGIPPGVVVRRKGWTTRLDVKGWVRFMGPDLPRIDHGSDTKRPRP